MNGRYNNGQFCKCITSRIAQFHSHCYLDGRNYLANLQALQEIKQMCEMCKMNKAYYRPPHQYTPPTTHLGKT